MARTYKDGNKRSAGGGRRQYQLSARAVRRDSPDLRKLARALIQLAMAEAEAQTSANERAARATGSQLPEDGADQPKAKSDRA